MARFAIEIESPVAPDAAFKLLADASNFQDWDPGVSRSVQVGGDGPGLGATFDVTVNGVGKELTLTYETVEFDEPTLVRLRAESSMLVSDDTITVAANGSGSKVTYDAVLALKGVLRIANPLLALGFRRIGRRAELGLRQALSA